MSVDIAYIKSLAPEFSSESDSRINFAIGIAQNFINSDFWPATQVDFAVALYACHLMKVGNLKGAIGLGSKKAGDLMTGFTGSRLSDPLAATGYGLMLLQAMSTLMISPIVFGTSTTIAPVDPTTLDWPD